MVINLEDVLSKAQYEFLPNDRLYYGEIPGIEGVYATANSIEECHKELKSVLEDWANL